MDRDKQSESVRRYRERHHRDLTEKRQAWLMNVLMHDSKPDEDGLPTSFPQVFTDVTPMECVFPFKDQAEADAWFVKYVFKPVTDDFARNKEGIMKKQYPSIFAGEEEMV